MYYLPKMVRTIYTYTKVLYPELPTIIGKSTILYILINQLLKLYVYTNVFNIKMLLNSGIRPDITDLVQLIYFIVGPSVTTEIFRFLGNKISQ